MRKRWHIGMAEVSVHVSEAARGKGVGRLLLQHLIRESEAKKYLHIAGRYFSENIASVKIHEQCGFRIVGKRERIGKINDVWRDTLLFEKRSEIAGI